MRCRGRKVIDIVISNAMNEPLHDNAQMKYINTQHTQQRYAHRRIYLNAKKGKGNVAQSIARLGPWDFF